jgi:hypothetical protein
MQKVPLQLGTARMLECDKHCDAPSKSCQAHQFSPVFLPDSAKSQREYNPPKTRLNTWASLITIGCAATPIVSKVSDPNLHTQWDHQETLLSEIIIRLGKAWVELHTPFSTSQSREAERLNQIKLIDNVKDRSCVRVVLHLNNYPSPLSLRKPSSIISCYTTSANSTSSQESTTSENIKSVYCLQKSVNN